MKTKKKIFRIALGILFLLNPCITVIDLLPDFIGCLLIISGLSSLRDISDSLEESRLNFLRLFWISLSHIPAFALMIFISSSFVSEKTSILVFAFVYAVVEFVLINNALKSLIDGFVYIGERHDGDCCFYLTKKNGKKIDVSKLQLFSTFFLLVVKGMSVAPNFVYLYDTSLGYGSVISQYAVNPVQFIGPLTALCFIPGIVVGIIWAKKMFRYIRAISNDKVFIERIDTVLSDKAVENTAVYKYRRISTATFVLFAGFALCVDMYIDQFNVIPDIIGACVFLAAAIYMKRKFAEANFASIITCFMYTLSSAVMFCYSVYFNSHFRFSDVGRVLEADSAYTLYMVICAVCEVLFVVSVIALIASYTSVLRGGFAVAVREGHKKNGKDIFLQRLKLKNSVSVILAVAASVCHFVHLLSLGDMQRVLVDKNSYTTTTSIYMPVLEGFWMLALLASIVFAVFTWATISSTRDELKERLYII